MKQIRALNPDEATDTMNAWVEWARNKAMVRLEPVAGASVGGWSLKTALSASLMPASSTMDVSAVQPLN